MFNFLKKKGRNGFRHWQIPVDNQFKEIRHEDSVQFVNTDQSQILYFSIISFSEVEDLGEGIIAKMRPTTYQTEHGWQLKGAKQGRNELLICAFTFVRQLDIEFGMKLFDSIVYVD